MATLTDLDERTRSEIETALRLPCEMPGCMSKHRDPATWEIAVVHGPATCGDERLLICSQCRNGLHLYRHQQVECGRHGLLGYAVSAWWRPIRVL